MSLHHRNFDLAHSLRWNKSYVSTELRNLLKRDLQLAEVCIYSDISAGAALLTDAQLTLLSGRRYGLVGRNGVGKSTLLRAIAEHRIMGIFDHLRIAYVDDGSDALRDTPDGACHIDSDESVLSYLLSLHKERVKLHKELQQLLESNVDVAAEELDELLSALEVVSDRNAESRLHAILAGLGVSGSASIASLSGGWRHRVILAASLFLEPDILLLDEPTNHLDAEGVLWLQQYLRSDAFKRSCICVVSHDSDFLDDIATDIILFEDQRLNYFTGNFSDFVATRQAQLQKHLRMYKAQEKLRRRLQDVIARLQSKAATSTTGKGCGVIRSRQRQLESRLGASLDGRYWKYCVMGPRPEILAPPESEPFSFDLQTDISDCPDAGEGADEQETTLIDVSDAGFSFVEGAKSDSVGGGGCIPWTFRHVSLATPITLSTRLGIVGRNGSGKSTLLKLLAGTDHLLTEGHILRWDGVRVGYLEQHAVKHLAMTAGELTALEWFSKRYGVDALSKREKDVTDALGRMGLSGILVDTVPLGRLSDGQRSRVLFADLQLQQPHVLLLDEPTSHLDAETSSALASALVEFDGAVVVASHHRAFLAEVCLEYFCLDSEHFGPLTGTLDALWEAKRQDAQSHDEQRCSARSPPLQQPQPEVTPEERRALSASEVKCRHCQGAHFSHSCPSKQIQGSETKCFATDDERRRREWFAAQQAVQESQLATQKGTKVRLPPTKEQASDGQGDWNVAVSKSVKRRLERGK